MSEFNFAFMMFMIVGIVMAWVLLAAFRAAVKEADQEQGPVAFKPVRMVRRRKARRKNVR